MKTTSDHLHHFGAAREHTKLDGLSGISTSARNRMKSACVFLFTLTPFLAASRLAGETPDKSAESKSAPSYVHVHDADKAMDEAVHEAQRTLAKFTAALTSPKSGQTGFALKKRCTKGDKCEHLWLASVHFDGRDLRGKVDNAPVELKTPRLGEEVTVQPEEITDWMYVENGRLVGGYTLRVFYSRLTPAEKTQFTKTMGFSLE